jgi:hypothetical protein
LSGDSRSSRFVIAPLNGGNVEDKWEIEHFIDGPVDDIKKALVKRIEDSHRKHKKEYTDKINKIEEYFDKKGEQ